MEIFSCGRKNVRWHSVELYVYQNAVLYYKLYYQTDDGHIKTEVPILVTVIEDH